jgi:hypothetical protein
MMNFQNRVLDVTLLVTLNAPTIVVYHFRLDVTPLTTAAIIQMNQLNCALKFHSVHVPKVNLSVAINAALNQIGNVITQMTAVTIQMKARASIMTVVQTNSNAAQVIALHKRNIVMEFEIV